MLLDIARRTGASLERVHAVGDSVRDIEAARAAGARPVLVRTGNGRKAENDLAGKLEGVAVHDDLAAFAAAVVTRS